MLTSLHIQNLVVVREIEIEFDAGLTVLSGETGAGKSILIEALGLALGDRADSDLIRQGAERATVTATFNLSASPEAQNFLRENALEVDEDCLLRRVLNRDGRSRAYCNSTPVSLSIVRDLASFLVDIHAQHAAQRLLSRDTQRSLLDNYGSHDELLGRVGEHYRRWHLANDELKRLDEKHKDPARVELLRYQLDELHGAKLDVEELNTIESEHKQLANRERNLQSCAAIRSLLADDTGINDNLSTALRLAESMLQEFPAAANVKECLAQAFAASDEALGELARLEGDADVAPEEFDRLDRRLDELHTLSHKHHTQIRKLGEIATAIEAEITEFESIEEQRQALQVAITACSERYQTAAESLSAARGNAASRIDADVTSRLRQLGMPNAAFVASLAPKSDRTPNPNGVDQIEFSVSTNPAASPGPLGKIASGGELSRIALAIQAATATHTGVPVVVYDEVDTGIGGNTANIVGRSLRDVAQHAQVICITHSPQVASAGDHHALIEKHLEKGEARTSVRFLDTAAREQEIARMLGATDTTVSSIGHARELIANSRR